MPRVLFLMPTKTYRASAFLEAAERQRIDAVVGSERRQALEALSPGKTLTLDFYNFEKARASIVEFARSYALDAIIPVDEDTAVLAAVACQTLSLPHNSPASAYAAREKQRMRKILTQAGLPSPEFELFPIAANPEALSEDIRYPCVLKPLFLSSSRGVIRADNPEGFVQAFNRVKSILEEPEVVKRGKKLSQQILVETFIPGAEIAVEGIFTRGQLKVLAIFDKPDPLNGPYFAETIYVTPSRHPEQLQKEIVQCVARASQAMGIRHGPVHAELRVNDAGPWIIEIAARSIGGLCSKTLRFDDGLSLEELIMKHAVGEDVESLHREESAAGVMMIPISKAGTLQEIRNLEEAKSVAAIEDIKITIPLTQRVVPLPEGNRYLGFIFARSDTAELTENALRKAFEKLEFSIEPS